MNGMAIHASDVVFQMLRAKEIGMLRPELVAGQAAPGRLFARQGGKADDLRGVGRFGVFLARTVTGFATLKFGPFVLAQSGFPMGTTVIALGLFLMARLAGFSSNVLRWVDRLMALRRG